MANNVKEALSKEKKTDSYIKKETTYTFSEHGSNFVRTTTAYKEKLYNNGNIYMESNSSFIKVWPQHEVENVCSWASLGRFYEIVRYLGIGNILYTRDRTKRPLYIKDIADIFGVSYVGAKKIVEEWAKMKLIKRVSYLRRQTNRCKPFARFMA